MSQTITTKKRSLFWVSLKNHDTGEWWECVIEADDRAHALEKFMRRTRIRDVILDAASKDDGPDRLTFIVHAPAKKRTTTTTAMNTLACPTCKRDERSGARV